MKEILTAIRIHNIISNIESFKNWLRKTHELEINSEIFIGYKYFIECSFHYLFNILENDITLGLEETELFQRANGNNVNLKDLYADCEKAYFLINVEKESKNLLRANTCEKLTEELIKFNNNVMKPLEETIGINLLSNDELLHHVISTLFLYFHQLDNYKEPFAHSTNFLHTKISNTKLEKAFPGYKYSLQYLWGVVFDFNAPTALSNMHKALHWTTPVEKVNDTKISTIEELFIFSESNDIVQGPKNDFANYFWVVRDHVILPLNQKLGYDIVTNNRKSNIDIKFPKDKLGALLKKIEVGRAKNFDELFLWYDAEYLDPDRSAMYLGIPMLLTLLEGAISIKKRTGQTDKTKVLRFKHKNNLIKDKEANDFTYGILLHSSVGTHTYMYGWLLFFQSCGDYSGFSGGQHKDIEDAIKTHAQDIDCIELCLPLEELEVYLKKKTQLYYGEFSLLKKNEKKQGKEKELMGSLLELLCSHYCKIANPKTNVIWSWGGSMDQEIDLIIKDNGKTTLGECKIDPNSKWLDLENEIVKLIKKRECLFDINEEIQLHFFFYFEPNSIQKQLLLKYDMEYTVISIVGKHVLNLTNNRIFGLFGNNYE